MILRISLKSTEKKRSSPIGSSALMAFFLLWTNGSTLSAESKKFSFESGPDQVPLVELYSSEGCSSCPAADRWISRLKNKPKLWKEFTPLVFHVDYWDYIGWKDPFARKEFTARQRQYASLWGNQTIYTPGFVLNGKEWKGWYFSRSLPEPETMKTGVLKLNQKSNLEFEIQFNPSLRGFEGGTAHAVLIGFDLSSDVLRGENRGKNLKHQFVVLDYKNSDLKESDKTFTTSIHLKKSTRESSQYGVAAWITKKDKISPLQSVGGFLKDLN